METLKILVMNWRDITNPGAGGAEVHIHEVAKRWVKRGHEVTLLCGRYDGSEEDDEIDGVEIIRRGGPYTVYLHAMKEYLWNLRKRSYDIVIDDINGVPFFTPIYVKRPKIAIMHHLVKDIFFKELPLHKAVLGYVAEKTIRLIYRDTPFIAVSESTKEDLMKFGIPKENINVIYNGVDHEVYKPSLHSKSPNPHVVYIGRLKQYKNLAHLLRAMKIVVNTKQLNDVKLTIAGRGDFEELKKAVAELGISRYVELLGEVNDNKKVELFDRAWVYVTTSSREGWGLTVIEANACGTPAVAYNVPGLRDSIIDGETGLLVPYGDLEALAKAVIKVLTDDGMRKKMSINAMKWARRFDWNRTAEEVMKVLEYDNQ
ncbi:MAG: glycosyltransferase family 1 protein [Dehalococcoidia bacterium]|nr:MAG: glycosyltransferase family 1 protein [Dehalococcoidia bacterium]